jgi:hypothetical protein
MHLEPISKVNESLSYLMRNIFTILEASTMISNNIGEALA